MEITEVRVKLVDDPDSRLQAFCSITLDDGFVVRDLKIIDGVDGLFVAMPARKTMKNCPKCGTKNFSMAAFCNSCGGRLSPGDAGEKQHFDVAHPINRECREMIQSRVIAQFERERRRTRDDGYRSDSATSSPTVQTGNAI